VIHQKWSVLKTSPKYVYSGEHTTLYINTKNSQCLSQCADIFTIIHFFVRSHSVGTFGMISISTTFTMELEPLINVFSSLFYPCVLHFSMRWLCLRTSDNACKGSEEIRLRASEEYREEENNARGNRFADGGNNFHVMMTL